MARQEGTQVCRSLSEAVVRRPNMEDEIILQPALCDGLRPILSFRHASGTSLSDKYTEVEIHELTVDLLYILHIQPQRQQCFPQQIYSAIPYMPLEISKP